MYPPRKKYIINSEDFDLSKDGMKMLLNNNTVQTKYMFLVHLFNAHKVKMCTHEHLLDPASLKRIEIGAGRFGNRKTYNIIPVKYRGVRWNTSNSTREEGGRCYSAGARAGGWEREKVVMGGANWSLSEEANTKVIYCMCFISASMKM